MPKRLKALRDRRLNNLLSVFFLAGALVVPRLLYAESTAEEVKQLKERIVVLEDQQNSVWDELGRRINIGGYSVIQYEKFQNNPNHFDGLKIELLFEGRIHDRIRFYNEIEFTQLAALEVPETETETCTTPTGTTTCVTGVNGGKSGEIEVEQAYLDFVITKWINFRGGIFPVPFGYFNLNHFDPRSDLTDRPLVARRVVPTTWADVGAGLFGTVPLTDNANIAYEVYVINGLDDGFSTTSGGLRGARPGFAKDNNGDKSVAGRAALKLFDQYEVGVSGYRGDYDNASNRAITGFDADISLKPRGVKALEKFELLGEFAHFTVEDSATPSILWGVYAELRYHFWAHFLDKSFLGKGFNNPTFTLTTRYDHAAINTTAGTGNLKENRVTFGLNYRPIEDFVFKTEYQLNSGEIERGDDDGFLASLSWLF